MIKNTINDGSNGQIIKNFSAILPRVRISIFPIDLIIEAINGGDLS